MSSNDWLNLNQISFVCMRGHGTPDNSSVNSVTLRWRCVSTFSVTFADSLKPNHENLSCPLVAMVTHLLLCCRCTKCHKHFITIYVIHFVVSSRTRKIGRNKSRIKKEIAFQTYQNFIAWRDFTNVYFMARCFLFFRINGISLWTTHILS